MRGPKTITHSPPREFHTTRHYSRKLKTGSAPRRSRTPALPTALLLIAYVEVVVDHLYLTRGLSAPRRRLCFACIHPPSTMLSGASLLFRGPPMAIRPRPHTPLATEPTQPPSHSPAASAPLEIVTSDSATRTGTHLRASLRACAFRPPSMARSSPSPACPLAVTTSNPPLRTGTGS